MTTRPQVRSTRRGSIVPMLAVCVTALFMFVALAVDLGMLMVARTEFQNAADTGALTGTRNLDNKPASTDNNKVTAEAQARVVIKQNLNLSTAFTDAEIQSVTVGTYDYSTALGLFQLAYPATIPTTKSWTATKVTLSGSQPTYFARVFGVNTMPMVAVATSVHRPRDIAMVLDFTGSMGFGSVPNLADVGSFAHGFNSTDTSYPQFGSYSRFQDATRYSVGTPSNSATGASARPNPFVQTATATAGSYVYAPGNFTNTNNNGPPIVQDFRYDPANLASPTTTQIPVNSAGLANAFEAATFSATTRTPGVGPTPAPDNFKDQTDVPVAYVGDKFPRKRGAATGATWAVTDTNGTAVNVAELLGWCPRFAAGSAAAWIGNPPIRTGMPAPNGTAYTTNWSDFRDATWETYGYDMDVADYIAMRPANHDPRNTLPSNAGGSVVGQVKVTPGKFNGYSMGPGYWGKTFFTWPPDPRAANDWRRKFFLKASGAAFATNGANPPPAPGVYESIVDADTATATVMQTIDEKLIRAGAGSTLLAASGNYTINYAAVLAWIKSGPPVLPPNMRAGRVLYYSSIPNDTNNTVGTNDEKLDKTFWRAYIDFVLNGADRYTAGSEVVGWPENTATTITPARIIGALNGFDPDGAGLTPAGPRPYMGYTDNPSRPRMHFWFGPITMMNFLYANGMYAGTVHEAQCWQLKAGVSSSIGDIRNNHPNDQVGLAFFQTSGTASTSYQTPIVDMGQDWQTMRDALYYPRTLLATTTSNPNTEFRPYNTAMTYLGGANIPNAQNATDPNSGLSMAYNMLSSSTNAAVHPDPTRTGRRGASKIVIFETDGIPNNVQNYTFNQLGFNSYYSLGGASPGAADTAAINAVTQIRKATSLTAAGDSGHSLPNAPARVYAIGFGDIFSTANATTAKTFLLNIQKAGGTSEAAASSIPNEQIITGTYTTRIDNLKTALERILQSGVQVTLIE